MTVSARSPATPRTAGRSRWLRPEWPARSVQRGQGRRPVVATGARHQPGGLHQPRDAPAGAALRRGLAPITSDQRTDSDDSAEQDDDAGRDGPRVGPRAPGSPTGALLAAASRFRPAWPRSRPPRHGQPAGVLRPRALCPGARRRRGHGRCRQLAEQGAGVDQQRGLACAIGATGDMGSQIGFAGRPVEHAGPADPQSGKPTTGRLARRRWHGPGPARGRWAPAWVGPSQAPYHLAIRSVS